jgi:hypothetical protein
MYRFIDEKQLMMSLENKSFLVKLPLVWKDKWEGFPYSLLDNEAGKVKIQRYFERNGIPFEPGIISILKNTVYCLCFTKCSESSALWDTYYNHCDVVRIEVDKIQFRKELCDDHFTYLKPIEYVLEPNSEPFLMQTLKKIVRKKTHGMTKTQPIYGFIFKRRETFSWEKEIRFLWYRPSNLSIPVQNSNQTIFNLNPSLNKTEIESEVYRNWKCNTNKLIKSVLVHPDASMAFCEKIRKICDKHEIIFLGKSKMNDAPTIESK